jgi:ABC-2 type transport system permease protein
MDFASLTRDTVFMLFFMFSDILANASAVSGLFLLAWRFGGLGSLDKFEVLFMLAYGNIITGILNIWGGNNFVYPSRIIARGQMEHMFIIPLPFFTQMTIGFYPFTCSSTFLTGVILMAVSVFNIGAVLPVWWALALAANIIISVVITVALSYLVSTLAFYAPVQCEEISADVLYCALYTSQFPLSGMPAYIKYPLLTIFPAGLLAWLPAMIIFGRSTAASNFYPLLFAAALTLCASYFFRKGLRYYVKKGINRYHAGGHRR